MFGVYLLNFPEYEKLAQKAIAILTQMPTTYLYEESFSNLVEIKSKKKNSIHDIDSLTLEVPEILHYLEVPSGVKLTLLFINAF